MTIEVVEHHQAVRQLHGARPTSASRSTRASSSALLGPSGSGKTTLLRIIAGLEFPPTAAACCFYGEDALRAQRRASAQVGFVFQHYALFRHMTVFENVAFGLRCPAARPAAARGGDPREGQRAAASWSSSSWLADRYPIPAFRRPAAARGAGPRAGDRAEGAAARRAVRRARRQGAEGAAPLAAPAARRACTSPASSSPTTRRRRWSWPTGSS